MSEKHTYKVNDFVWAKVSGCPYWPAVVQESNPQSPSTSKKQSYWLYFFGSCNYAWVSEKFLKPYDEYKKKMLDNCTAGVLAANKELKYNKKKLLEDPNFQIKVVPFIAKEKKNKRKRSRSRASSVQSRTLSIQSRASKILARSASLQSIAFSVRSYSSTGGPHRTNHDFLRCFPKDTSKSIIREIPKSKKPISQGHNERGLEKFFTRNAEITTVTIGILASNLYAEAAGKNLIKFGHNVVCWSPSKPLCKRLAQYSQNWSQYFKVYGSARHVTQESSIIFSFMSTEDELKTVYDELGLCNPNDNLMSGKTYVEMSEIVKFDDIFEIINNMQKINAGYLAAMVQGTKDEIERREAVLLIGGENAKKYVTEYNSCFMALAKVSLNIGTFDKTVKLHVINQSIKATILVTFMEALALVDKKTSKLHRFVKVVQKIDFCTPYLLQKYETVRRKHYSHVQETYYSFQTSLSSSLSIANKWCQPLSTALATNQLFKIAQKQGHDDKDVSSIYLLFKN